MTETLNSYHSMYASLSADITAHIGKISALAREDNGDKSGELLSSVAASLTFKTMREPLQPFFCKAVFNIRPQQLFIRSRDDLSLGSGCIPNFHHMDSNQLLLMLEPEANVYFFLSKPA